MTIFYLYILLKEKFFMYSIGQFSKIINVSIRTLQRWDKKGKLVPNHLGSGHRRYTDDHIKIYINMKTNKYKEKIKEIENKINL